jgi:CRP-like cAMP-binding protein
MSLNQVDFFTNLPRQIKNEWIFTMKQRQLEKGSLLYRIDTFSDEMYVLQSGLVEITHQMDNGDEFVIERLMRGSVVNHNSFLMNDGIDTDAKCRTAISLYYITI